MDVTVKIVCHPLASSRVVRYGCSHSQNGWLFHQGSAAQRIIEQLRRGKHISEPEVRDLCNMARDILVDEPNVPRVDAPVTVCGDIHGQFYDLLELFRKGGECPAQKYIFMGDYVDRGQNSVETILLLLALKVRYPDRMTLIRGNHESREMTQMYGFYSECWNKYGNANVWNYCCDVFNYLVLAAIIDDKILAVHGGLSPMAESVDAIREIDRKQEIPQNGVMSDIMWSDPDDYTKGWGMSSRGAGFVFGSEVVNKFLHQNNLTMIARAHQLVMEGYKMMFDKKLVTVWSAPNYLYRSGNVAAIMELDSQLNYSFKKFNSGTRDLSSFPSRQPGSEYFI